MSAQKQKALFLEKKFGEFVVGEADIPQPGPGEILVKTKSVALNPVDWKIQKYGLFIEVFPAVVGFDVAGEVVEVGKEVTGFGTGDRVFFLALPDDTNRRAGYQQYTIAVPQFTAKIPENLSFDEVATIPGGLIAFWVGAYNKPPHGWGLPLPSLSDSSASTALSGKPIIIFGGASSVGQYAIQIAKLSGFSSIITTASLKHTSYLKSLGASHVIDRNIPLSSLASEVGKLTSAPIEYVFDAISVAETQQAGYDLLAPGGKLLIVLWESIANKNASDDKTVLQVAGTLSYPSNIDALTHLYKVLPELLANSIIKPNKVEVLPGGLGGIVAGLNRLENNEVSGVKLVVHPQETS